MTLYDRATKVTRLRAYSNTISAVVVFGVVSTVIGIEETGNAEALRLIDTVVDISGVKPEVV